MPKEPKLDTTRYFVQSDSFSLSKFDPKEHQNWTKKEGREKLKNNQEAMFSLQQKLYAENKQALILVFQAMDAAGKDGCIKHVMRGLNPQGTNVVSFKQPSSEELDRDYLWRINRALPRRGEIGIFNRSHYEEVVVAQLHHLVDNQQLPDSILEKSIWKERYRQISDWERYLHEQGYHIVKFFLHISREEQRQRLLARIEEKDKNWKFSASDIAEREHWDEYQKLYEKALQKTSTDNCPWYVIPADHKWFSRLVVSQIVRETLERMNPQYPRLSEQEEHALEKWRKVLEQQAYVSITQ